MKPRDYVVHDAPESTEAHWLVLDDALLHIWIDPDMDDLAQWRFIQNACELNGLEPRRHRKSPLVPLLAAKQLRHVASASKAVTTVVTAGVAAAGVAAALLPGALEGNQNTLSRPPNATGPAPTRLAPPATRQPPVSPPRKAAGHPQPAGASAALDAQPSVSMSVHAAQISAGAGVRMPHVRARLPKLPVSLPVHIPRPVPRRQQPLLAVSLPVAGLAVHAPPGPLIQAHIGSLSP